MEKEALKRGEMLNKRSNSYFKFYSATFRKVDFYLSLLWHSASVS
jgi:hypothetical protein